MYCLALEWDNNETEEEIFDTTSFLVLEIDICVIYQYEGDSEFTKYRLVSTVMFQVSSYVSVLFKFPMLVETTLMF